MIQVDESDPVGELEPSFPYRDVTIRRGVDMKELYDLQSELGRGKFGTVYQCQEMSTGLQLAAKFVATPKREDRRNVEREIEIMRLLQHPRLIQLYDAFDNGKVMCVVLELIEGGELFERVIDDDFILTEKSCTVFMRQICEGIEFIHKQNILHLDMKPENILCLTRTGNRIKIIDFGLARKYDPQKKLQVLFGTPEFVAPEIVNFEQISFGTDMWSVGVICYVLLSGLSPFMGGTDIETMANVTIAKYDFDDEVFNEISQDAKDFIQKLLLKDKERRMSATQCLAHTWLRRKPKPPPPVAEELDIAKDNLRFFVERWNEHPNSPYLFDKSCHTISPCILMSQEIETVPSQNSLGGLSPSPCSSLSVSVSTSPDSILEHELLGKSPDETDYLHHYTFENKQPPPPKYHLERLQTFERRASDSSCVLRRNGDTAARVNLADEIRKLSDKLFQMASLHGPSSDLDNNNVSSIRAPAPAIPSTHHGSIQSTVFNGTPHPIPPVPSRKDSIQDEGLTGVKRPKFRFSNLNRDVPLGAPAPPTNFTSFMVANTTSISPCSSWNSLDTFPSTSNNSQSSASPSHSAPVSPQHSSEADHSETPCADITKDLLLHLLDKWDDKQTVTCSPIETCRKSLSMDWSEEESLGQRTMTSLATYFQSSRTIKKKHSVLPSQFGV
ncbi:myosin light chain kinase, smooth muscle-like isoform X2 [Zootermopsis nevadensis]|uniref:myosin light chain kinase, smooth muscle-like isoform X2 n=1 Tax=Zootermopsis nevadensis TaxID=136037 RepID=UPI000B8E8B09|nr:myosin light chain kinase, smooth muscle-like isoform X2 [Zootermopsis nevadensis]XP_021913525.1 myosin light chain kinase, smooth muscle-like isoform X2 [Zootermopsis nevadensis]